MLNILKHMTHSEYLLHYVWKFRLFNQTNLQTLDGKKIEKSDYKGYFNLTSTKTFFGLRYNEEYKNPYKGYLYNFKVYSGILTDEQIKKLYQDEKIE